MTETRDIRAVVDAAEQAAAAGDYASAEQLLTEVAVLQGASLGPLHSDLANTLNNLGVVCEILEKPQRAERHFRRAWEIAAATLEPDNPFVATSRKNLEDFCNARGIAVDVPTAAQDPPAPVAQASTAAPARLAPVGPPPAVVVDNLAPPTSRVDRPIEHQTREDARPVAAEPPSRRIPVAALLAGALVVAIVAVVVWRNMSVPADMPREAAAPNPAPVAAAPPAVQAPEAAPASPPIVEPTPPPPPAAAPTSRARTAAPAAPPVVVSARLCKELSTGSDWHCAPPDSPIESGAVYFFSRVKSSTDTTIRHRWYHGGRVLRTAELRIGANATDGYRTFSRTTVNGRGSADWKVELISKDGVVLHEERFVVR
jgi:hypothetical protein